MTPNLSQHQDIRTPVPHWGSDSGVAPSWRGKKAAASAGLRNLLRQRGADSTWLPNPPWCQPRGEHDHTARKGQQLPAGSCRVLHGGAMCTPTLKIRICKTKHHPGLPAPPQCLVPWPQHQGLCVHPPSLAKWHRGQDEATRAGCRSLGTQRSGGWGATAAHQLHRTAEVSPPAALAMGPGGVVVSENPAKSLKSRIRCQLK